MLPLSPGSFFVSFSAANNFRDPRSLCRPLVGASALSGLLTVALFLYILLIPVIKGIPPNVRLAMSLRPCRCVVLPGSRWQLQLTLFLLAFFSIGRGESPVNFRPSFRCVVSSDVVQHPPCLPASPPNRTHWHLPSLFLFSSTRVCGSRKKGRV